MMKGSLRRRTARTVMHPVRGHSVVGARACVEYKVISGIGSNAPGTKVGIYRLTGKE
jgi:hypothetical protein